MLTDWSASVFVFYDQIFATLILQNVFLWGENEGNVGLVGRKIWNYENFCVILHAQNVGFGLNE